MRALAVGLHAAQGGGDGEGGIQAGGEVVDGHAAFHGGAAFFAGDAHQPAHGLQRQVEAAFLAARAALAVRRYRTIDQARVARAHGLLPQPQAVHDAGAVVFDQYVGAGDQLDGCVALGLVLQVQGDRALVAVQGGEVLAVAIGDGRPAAQGVACAGRLDLDDVGAHVGQQHAAERAGGHVADFDDAYACEGGFLVHFFSWCFRRRRRNSRRDNPCAPTTAAPPVAPATRIHAFSGLSAVRAGRRCPAPPRPCPAR